MKCSLVGLLVLLASPAFAQDAVPQIPFDASDPLKLPKDLYLGEVTGVAVNSKGNIFVLSRGNTTGPAYAAAAAQLLEFAPDGKFIREIGKNLYAWSFGHTVRVDRGDNIWVTDKGSDMVVKFNPQGRVLMVFGRKQEASDEDTAPLKHPKPPLAAEDGRFRQVTDVAFDPAGNAFITDGYVNSRGAVGGLHHARPEPGALHLGRVPGPRVQAVTRRKGARGARRVRQATEAVRLDPRDRLPVGERALRRGAAQLAGAEAGSASEEIASLPSPGRDCRSRRAPEEARPPPPANASVPCFTWAGAPGRPS